VQSLTVRNFCEARERPTFYYFFTKKIAQKERLDSRFCENDIELETALHSQR